ncbi:hypothetical protein LZ31DRAFT_277458 [Colletotrichum somersetense]|nr:hypothetical protein LZ31DRAFT_277458 [Colletotrichum somersetense]
MLFSGPGLHLTDTTLSWRMEQGPKASRFAAGIMVTSKGQRTLEKSQRPTLQCGLYTHAALSGDAFGSRRSFDGDSKTRLLALRAAVRVCVLHSDRQSALIGGGRVFLPPRGRGIAYMQGRGGGALRAEEIPGRARGSGDRSTCLIAIPRPRTAVH